MALLLDQINDPPILRDLTTDQLEGLAEEIRGRLVETLSRTGGHLSPNLGVVELTLALHRVFDSPTDRIIWDVGHQAYVHKLVTGRRDAFDSLRTFGGISGYPSRAESPHDHVENSHASTALSYALGLAIAAEDQGEERWTVAVIGDGALTGGMAYEALSHIAVRRPRRLVIVLNDNGMSYQATVGGVAASLVRGPARPALRVGQAHHRPGAAERAPCGRHRRRAGEASQGEPQATGRAEHRLRCHGDQVRRHRRRPRPRAGSKRRWSGRRDLTSRW